MSVIRVLVVDDQALVRAGVRALLEMTQDIEVVGEAADGDEAVRGTARLHPDVVLMDIRMPRLSGIDATRRILAAAPKTNVLMLTTFAEDENVYAALAAGAVGFMVKDGDPADMIEGVRRAARHEPTLAPAVLGRIVERARRSHDTDIESQVTTHDTLARLTARERDVLALIGAGMANAQIAARLNIGLTTVKTHVMTVMDKLCVRNRVQAGVWAHRLGLVNPQFQPTGWKAVPHSDRAVHR